MGFNSENAEILRGITVGLIGAMVADNAGVQNREALETTRKVVGRYAGVPLTDENIQEIALQALHEARAERNVRDAALAQPELFAARR